MLIAYIHITVTKTGVNTTSVYRDLLLVSNITVFNTFFDKVANYLTGSFLMKHMTVRYSPLHYLLLLIVIYTINEETFEGEINFHRFPRFSMNYTKVFLAMWLISIHACSKFYS